MVSSLRRRTLRSSGKPDTWPQTSRTGYQTRGRSSLPLNPMKGLYSLPISSAGWDFPSTHLFAGSCSTTGWTSTIWPPNFILNISTFIVVCEAFLRILPHFSLWLKIFNVKPKVVDGQHAECGGAMVSW